MEQGQLSDRVQKQVEAGIEIIRRGGVIAFPTDTVFGLGAGIYHEAAIERIYDIKQRPPDMALPILLAAVSQVHEVAQFLPAYAWRLIDRFLPGGLTLVVYRTGSVKDVITRGGDTVAIRVPDHPVPIALIQGSGTPIIGTSANLSGRPPVLAAEDVRSQLDAKVDLIIDGIPAPTGSESTVVDVTGEVAVILREGAISRVEIAQVTEVV
jgi:L-threonylcarbamoyladenylate synthase